MGLAVVLALRLALPLTVLRSPFWGALLTIAADAVDILIFQMSDFPAVGYHRADKALDAYYITVELVAAQRWANLPRVTATAL